MEDLFSQCYDFKESRMAKAVGMYPYFKAIEGSEGSKVVINSKSLIMMGSNNYLGLTHDPRVIEASIDALRKFGTGCTGSRCLNGNLSLHEELEVKLASFVNKPSALVFSTGFHVNQGVIATLPTKGSVIVSDEENHASIIDGCHQSKATVKRYKHNNMEDLRAVLSEIPVTTPKLIVSDAVFSMSGDVVDLPALISVKNEFENGRVYIDDAHGLGVFGPKGSGTTAHFNLTESVDLIMGTFSKSFASIGGFVASEDDVIEFLKHKTRTLMFSAAMPAAACGTVLKCLEIIQNEPERIEYLWRLADYLKRGYHEIGLITLNSKSPILPIYIGKEGKTFMIVKELFERGVFATPVIYPAVPYGQGMIRTSVMATHTFEQLDQVLEVLRDIAKKYRLTSKDLEYPPKEVATSYSFEIF